jgi:hypothetical protein
LIFPGLGLGVAVAKARRINEPMLEAAADAVAELSDAMTPGAALLPPVESLRMVSAAVGVAVAVAAEKAGLAQVELSSPVQQIHQAMWRPAYPQMEPIQKILAQQAGPQGCTRVVSGRRMPVEGHHGEQCRRRCHPAGRRHGHDPSPDDAGYRRSGQGRSERSPFAAPPQRSGLLGDQGLVLCSAARPPDQRIALADYLDPMSPIEGASDEHQRIVLDLGPGAISGCRPRGPGGVGQCGPRVV